MRPGMTLGSTLAQSSRSGWLDIEQMFESAVNMMQIPGGALIYAPLGLMVVTLFMSVQLWRQRRRVRRLQRDQSAVIAFGQEAFKRPFATSEDVIAEVRPIVHGARELLSRSESLEAQLRVAGRRAATSPASGPESGWSQPASEHPAVRLSDLSPQALAAAIDMAQQQLDALGEHPDAAAFERVIGLGSAFATLAQGLADVPPGPAAAAALRELLRDGIEEAGWLHRVFRAEMILRSLAPAGSHWSRLGTATGTVAALARAELQVRASRSSRRRCSAPYNASMKWPAMVSARCTGSAFSRRRCGPPSIRWPTAAAWSSIACGSVSARRVRAASEAGIIRPSSRSIIHRSGGDRADAAGTYWVAEPALKVLR